MTDENDSGKQPDTVDEITRQFWAAKDQLDRKREAAAKSQAEDPRNAHFPKHYPAACREWALRDYWTPQETANLLAGCDPTRPSKLPGTPRLNADVQRVLGILERTDLARKEGRTKTFPARQVVAWARDKRMEVPAALLEAMGLAPAEPEEAEPLNRQSQLDRELCRAIARTLWDEYPQMNITHMARHRSIKLYGNGGQYKLDTLKGWIRDLDPRPEGSKGGRPRKETGVTPEGTATRGHDDS